MKTIEIMTTDELIAKIKNLKNQEVDIIDPYTEAVYGYIVAARTFDWPAINRAITDRWDRGALARIKAAAWAALRR